MKVRLTLSILILCALFVINVAKLVAEEAWTRKADMPTPRSSFAICMVNGKIYVIGGKINRIGDMAISTVEMYDPKTDAWEQKTDMPTVRSNVSVSVVDGKIYAIGGAKRRKRKIGPGFSYNIKYFPTVEMYNPVTDTWTRKADMPTPRITNACVVDGKIYAIGGTSKSSSGKLRRLKTVEVYDPVTDTWTSAKGMNYERAWPAFCVVNEMIYVMGGMGMTEIPNHPGSYHASVEMFNPKTNEWHERAEMSAAKSSHTASVVNGKIYVIGGGFLDNGLYMYFPTIDIYHPQTDKWTQKPDMRVGRASHRAQVIGGKIYIFGGRDGGDVDPLVTVDVYDTGEVP